MIFTNDFKHKDNVVTAGEILTSELGDVVQALYDGGATTVTIAKYPVRPLDPTNDEYNTSIIAYINGRAYTNKIGDYIVWEETEFGEVVYLQDKDVFENKYEVIV